MVTNLALPRLIAPVAKPPTWLRADWRFGIGEGAYLPDLSRYRNHGTIYGATWAVGRHGKALSFDGVDNYVVCAHAASLDITDKISIEAWVKLDKVGSFQRICRKGNIAPFSGYFLRVQSNNRAYFAIYDLDANIRAAYSAAFLVTDRWYHIVGTYDRTRVRIYLDGVESLGAIETQQIKSNTENIYIGTGTTKYNLFDGLIDMVRIYSRALTHNEVLARYNATK